jgi:hypothetical protein
MMTQAIDPNHFDQQSRRIRLDVSTILKKWGLLPRFKRWRLVKDPDSGMVVLFGILNNEYIAAHTSISFSDYFRERLLHDLADQLQVQVVSCNSDGLRYAFVLDRGRLDDLPTHVDFPYVDNGKLSIRVVYQDIPQPLPAPPANIDAVDDQNLVRRGVGAFLKVFDDIQLRNDAAFQLSTQTPPDIVLIDEAEFNRRIAEHEADQRRSKHNRELFDQTTGQR